MIKTTLIRVSRGTVDEPEEIRAYTFYGSLPVVRDIRVFSTWEQAMDAFSGKCPFVDINSVGTYRYEEMIDLPCLRLNN